MRRLASDFGKFCDRRKLGVNVGKSKVIRVERNENGENMGMDVRLGGGRLEEVKCFKYF